MNTEQAEQSRSRCEPKPITLQDLLSDLLWPSLLRVGALSLRADRIGLAFGSLIAISALCGLLRLWPAGGVFIHELTSRVTASSVLMRDSVVALDPARAVAAAADVVAIGPRDVAAAHPFAAIIVGIGALGIFSIFGVAISRSVAIEFSRSGTLGWARALGFGIRAGPYAFASLALPLFIAGLMLLVLACLGWAFLNVPYLSAVGAALYPVALLIGTLVCAIAAILAAAHPLLIPAVACEGTDASDAMQRAFAYVIAKPLRLTIYYLVLLLQMAIVTTLTALFVGFVLRVTSDATTAWVGPQGTLVDGIVVPAAGHTLVAPLLGFWAKLMWLLVASVGVSFYFSGSTVAYLLVRRLCDGQDIEDVWQPGLTRGTVAPVPSKRRRDDSDDE